MTRDPLLHIGYHRTGSTWLQNRVFNDPALGFTKAVTTDIDQAFISINPFTFDAESARARFNDLFGEAARRDVVPVLTHERLSGVPLGGGPEVPVIGERLAAAFPNGRVLIIIREQQDLILSVYKHYLLRLGTLPLERVFRERTVMQRRMPSASFETFKFHHLIEHYQKLFGPDRVLVLTYEQLRADPQAFLGAITTFAGVPTPTSVRAEPENVSLPTFALLLLRYVNAFMQRIGLGSVFQGPILESRARKGRIVALGYVGRFAPTSLSRRVEARWKRRIAELATDVFGESNRITQEITGIDLGSLGYDITTRTGDPETVRHAS